MSLTTAARPVAPGRHLTGFWLVAAAFAGLTAFGTIPTPLWPLYALSPTDVTTAFAVMVVGAGAGLYFLGHLSDRFGRRRVIAPALATALAADIVIAVWPVFAGLIAGRVLTGVAVGLMASTATTYLSDLYAAARPGSRSGRPATVATLANLGGFSVGPLISGALAEWGPGDRLRTPYVLMGATLALALVAVGFSPETVDLQARLTQSRPARFRLLPGPPA
ncbi:MFS transporter [Actinoplanes sp. NPDC051411]|uniref:MFS transporter n=1 Tax=Actinoplanes sp. NPDC051411 TaxID=3155522 RepID=UPI003424EAD7